MKTLINIGNTNTQIASVEDDFKTIVIPTKYFSSGDIPKNSDIAICAVVKKKIEELKKNNNDFFQLTSKSKLNWSSNINITSLGADRIANISRLAYLAKLKKIPLPVICIDFGTAITFEVLDVNYKFVGGVILPGRKLLRKSLNAWTDQLPVVKMDIKLNNFLGKSTDESIGIGVDFGCVGAVKSIINGIKLELNSKIVYLIGVGGDVDYFSNKIDDLNIEDKTFTLRGLLNAWEVNIES